MSLIYEAVIQQTGWGAYNKFMISICGFWLISLMFARMSIPIAVPLSTCDANLGKTSAILTNSIFSLGSGIGGYIFNSISDISGRKCFITFATTVVFISCFSSAFISNQSMFGMCMFFLGAGLEASIISIKILLAECLPARKRGRHLISLDLFWYIGYIVCIGIGWFMMPMLIESTKQVQGEFRMASWRVLFGLSTITILISSCLTGLLQESPRYLLTELKVQEAHDSLKHIYAINNSKHANSFRVTDISDCGIVAQPFLTEPLPRSCTDNLVTCFCKLFTVTKTAFKQQYCMCTLAGSLLRIFLVADIFTVNLWLSKNVFFTTYASFDGNNTAASCHMEAADLLFIGEFKDGTTCPKSVNNSLYGYFLVIAAFIILGLVINYYTLDMYGRKPSFVTGVLLCCVSGFTLKYAFHYPVNLVLCCAFMLGYSIALSALDVILIESFPTRIRGTANGIVRLPGHLACAFMKQYISFDCANLCQIFGGLLAVSAGLVIFFPETKRQPMVE